MLRSFGRSAATCAVLLCCAVALFAEEPPSRALPNEASQAADEQLVKKFINAYSVIEQYAADPFDADKAFYEGAIPGSLRKLDPHSVFFDPGQYQQLQQMESSTRKGFGSVVSVLPGRVLVLQTLPNTPSAKAGMSPGDEILVVNNYRLDRLDAEQIIQLLSESKQRPARLLVRRPGSVRLLDMNLIPENMQSSSVERTFMLRDGVGYIRVGAFEEKTAREIHEAIEKLGGRNLKALVIDLRNNPGGLMTGALQTASYFLKPGQPILSVKGRNVAETIEKVPAENIPYTFPVSIIVNAKTASASEIVSGALQDHDRATIVGEPSYGKGLVQSVYPLQEKTGLALTTAFYYIPSGRSIQKSFDEQRGSSVEQFALGKTVGHPNERTDFHTDDGRKVPGGGGIVPDVIVGPPAMTEFRAVLEQSAAFTAFATEYIRDHKIEPGWDLPAEIVDQFQAWLGERRIQPSLHEWVSERDFIRARLKGELYNLTLGVEKGDEVESVIDPQIQAALEAALHPHL